MKLAHRATVDVMVQATMRLRKVMIGDKQGGHQKRDQTNKIIVGRAT